MIFWKLRKNGRQCGKDLWRLLRRTKPCIDRFRRNTSQNNYFEGFWRIKSLTNANIKDAFSPLFWCSLTVHLCLHVSYSIFLRKPDIKRIECFHMTSRRPYWCPKTMKWRPCWCPKPILWELNSFFMQSLSFAPINLHRCWPREWKRSILLSKHTTK